MSKLNKKSSFLCNVFKKDLIKIIRDSLKCLCATQHTEIKNE